MTKKQIFWLIVTIIAIGIGLYLKLGGFGDTLMSLLIGTIGIIIGWIAKCLYNKYIKEDERNNHEYLPDWAIIEIK